MVAHGGVPLALVEGYASQGDALVDADVLADDRRLSDNHADGVVHEEPLADGGAGVDVAAGEVDGSEIELPGLVELAGHPELVGLPVQADRVESCVVPYGVFLVHDRGVLLHDGR